MVALSGDTAKSKQGGRVLVPNNHVWALSDNLKCPTVLDSRAYGPVYFLKFIFINNFRLIMVS